MTIAFNCLNYDSSGNPGRGVLKLSPSLGGAWTGIGIFSDPLVLSPSLGGGLVVGLVFNVDPLVLNPSLYGDVTFALPTLNWVAWSDIGSINFTIDRKNTAGNRPMDWIGVVHDILKLGNNPSYVIVYGSGGVSRLTPFENTFGLSNINMVGLLGPWSVCGDDDVHFFIDGDGKLWSLADRLEKLDYSEFLNKMDSPIMTLDKFNELVFICDGTLGYVYSVRDHSLGTGPNNITCVGNAVGTQYFAASGDVSTPVFEFCSDSFDLRSRRHKSIASLEFGAVPQGDAYAALDIKVHPNKSFITTPWVPVGPNGVCNVRGFGQEFRVRYKLSSYEDISMGWYKLHGMMDEYKPNDTE